MNLMCFENGFYVQIKHCPENQILENVCRLKGETPAAWKVVLMFSNLRL